MPSKPKDEAKSASLIVKSAIRKYVNAKGCNISSEVLNNTLNKAILKILDKAIEKASNDKRKTLKPSDITV